MPVHQVSVAVYQAICIALSENHPSRYIGYKRYLCLPLSAQQSFKHPSTALKSSGCKKVLVKSRTAMLLLWQEGHARECSRKRSKPQILQLESLHCGVSNSNTSQSICNLSLQDTWDAEMTKCTTALKTKAVVEHCKFAMLRICWMLTHMSPCWPWDTPWCNAQFFGIISSSLPVAGKLNLHGQFSCRLKSGTGLNLALLTSVGCSLIREHEFMILACMQTDVILFYSGEQSREKHSEQGKQNLHWRIAI